VTRTISELLDDARARIERFEPAQALARVAGGAVIVDIRSRESRQRDGVIPGAVHVPRTVLEWRAAPSSEWRNSQLDGKELILV
jgi:rhodanese-related sulfurtransferase